MSRACQKHAKCSFLSSSPELVSKPDDLEMEAGELCEQIVAPQANNGQAIFYTYVTFLSNVLLQRNFSVKQAIVCHTPRCSWGVFERCIELQLGLLSQFRRKQRRKKDRVEPEAMVQISQRNC